MFYALVDLLRYDYTHLCCLCGFELFKAQNLTWQELIIASNKIYRCGREHKDSSPLSLFNNHYLSTKVKEKDSSIRTYQIDIRTISNLQGHFNFEELKVCNCEKPLHCSYLVTMKYPACCIDCGSWCRIDGEPNRSRHLSYDNFKEIYSASKYLRHRMSDQIKESVILIPEPFLRDW